MKAGLSRAGPNAAIMGLARRMHRARRGMAIGGSDAVANAIALHRKPSGECRLNNKFRYLIARA
jgi:hypothetical protein